MHSAMADDEFFGYLSVGKALGNIAQDLDFAFGKTVVFIGCATRWLFRWERLQSGL